MADVRDILVAGVQKDFDWLIEEFSASIDLTFEVIKEKGLSNWMAWALIFGIISSIHDRFSENYNMWEVGTSKEVKEIFLEHLREEIEGI